jgi:hypothetical protein
MKNVCLLLALIAWFQTSAQEKTRIETKGYIGLSLGPSFPLGNFADKNSDNNKAGYAKTGIGITLANFGYKFGKHLGISAALLSSVNSARSKDLPMQSPMPWSLFSFLVGGLYTKNIGTSYFDGRCMVGYATISSPSYYFIDWDSASSFSYMFGIGIRPRIGNRFSLNFTLDYFHTKPTFEENNEQPISCVFVNGGFAYLLK